jgi:hypothetical protein
MSSLVIQQYLLQLRSCHNEVPDTSFQDNVSLTSTQKTVKTEQLVLSKKEESVGKISVLINLNELHSKLCVK